MKNVFILLLFAQLVSAQRSIDPGFFVDTDHTRILAGMADPVITFNADCIPYETFTPWVTTADGNSQDLSHHHKWVYADKSDVNPRKGPRYTLAIGCLSPCGCGETEIEARICSECFRHEIRQRSWGFSEKPAVESEYTKLKNKTKE